MLLSLKWLREFVPVEAGAQEVGDRLTMLGLELEDIIHPYDAIKDIVVGHVLTKEAHPDSDHLAVCTVDAGQEEVLNIVCGAPNVAAGQKVPVALVGTTMPGGMVIKKAKLRGVPSFGMICSERELGLSEDHNGIMVLPEGFKVGTRLIDALDLDTEILEIGITPNRGDCLSVLGLAREAALAFKLPLTLPKGHVYISNDWSALGRYLQRERRVYTLCEDTFGGTLDPDQHLLDEQRTNPRGPYRYWGDSPCCRTVESEDAARCSIFGVDKLVTVSKAQLLESLTDAEKAMVRSVFLTQPLPENAAGATLLLPRSFVLDGLMDQPTQDAMFAAVAKKYCTEPLFIKTHPRDTTDYSKLFPTAVILPRTMPSEVLNFCLPFKFQRAVTVQSWVLRGFTAAEEKVFVGLEEAEKLVQG